MLLEDNILDGPAPTEGWKTGPQWWRGYLFMLIVAPIVFGVLVFVLDRQSARFHNYLSDFILPGMIIGSLLAYFIFSSRYLSLSSWKLNLSQLAGLVYLQLILFLVLGENTERLILSFYYEYASGFQWRKPFFLEFDFEEWLEFVLLTVVAVPAMATAVRAWRRLPFLHAIVGTVVFGVVTIWMGLEIHKLL